MFVLWGDLAAVSLYLEGAVGKGDRLISRVCCDRTRGNGFKLKERSFRLQRRKKFFIIRVMRHWHRLPREVVDASSLKTLQVRLEGLSACCSCGCPCLAERSSNRWPLKVPSNSHHSVILSCWEGFKEDYYRLA